MLYKPKLVTELFISEFLFVYIIHVITTTTTTKVFLFLIFYYRAPAETLERKTFNFERPTISYGLIEKLLTCLFRQCFQT